MPARILIADDSLAVRSTLCSLLTAAGFDVCEAEDGQQALEKALELRPDLVVIDLAMPRLDGLNASLFISQQLPGTPIIMCTMHWAPHLQIEARKFGVRVVISKTDSKGLIGAVTQYLAAGAKDAEAQSAPSPIEPFVIPTKAVELSGAANPAPSPMEPESAQRESRKEETPGPEEC